MGINDSGRKKLVIVKLLERRKVGDAEVLEFTAHIEGEQSNAKHGVWLRPLDEHIKEASTIDCDVVVKTSDKMDPDGNPYQNRKVTQIYVDGKPVAEKKEFGGRYQRQDNTESIERQTAIKEIGEDWRAGKFNDDDKLVLAYKAWLLGRMSPPAPTSTSEISKPAPAKAEAPSVPPKPLTPATAAFQTPTGVHKRLKALVTENLITKEQAIAYLTEIGGIGVDTFEMVKSLTPDNLSKLDHWVQETGTPLWG